MRTLIFSLTTLALVSCGGMKTGNRSTEEISPTVASESPQKIDVIGIAYNQKGGAVVDVKNTIYWIDGLHSWEDRFLEKPVRVWGDWVVRYDNPVFLDTGTIIQQGIPVSSQEELEAQKTRNWILNASYEPVRP